VGSSRSLRRRGSIRQRGESSWELRVFVGVDPLTSKRQYVTRTVRGTRRDAEVECTKLLRQIDEGAVVPRAGTIGELVEAWYGLRSNNLSFPVAANYRRIIDRHILPRWGSTRLSRLRVQDLDLWYERLRNSGGVGGRPLAPNSVRRIHNVLHAALGQGVKWGLIASNPASYASPPPLRRQSINLTAGLQDLSRVLEAAGKVNRALPVFLRVAVATGARRGELCALRWRDVDLVKGTIRIARAFVQVPGKLIEKDTKTHQIRVVSIDSITLESLQALKAECASGCEQAGERLSETAFVFSHQPDGLLPWRPNYVTLAFSRLSKQLGLEGLRFHDLRHLSASLLLASGVDVKTVSARLGHAQTSTTLDVYAHVIEQVDGRAAELMGQLLPQPTQGTPGG